VWRIAASTSAVAATSIGGFRTMVVRSIERVSGTRRHAHRCVIRPRTMHRARWENNEKSAVGHEPESDKRTQHTCGERAAHHVEKV
jgi:hypothetical protein